MIAPWLLSMAAAVLLFIETEICDYNNKLFQMSVKNILMNTAIIFFVLLGVYIVCDRWWIPLGGGRNRLFPTWHY